MPSPRYPALYQVNTRVWLTELSRSLGKRATLDEIPDAAIEEWARQGFDWIWLLSVWQTGAAAQAVSRANPHWRREFEETLTDLTNDDIAGSGFAIKSYTVHQELGGDAALARLRERLKKRGLKLMLDFVPNHMAPDHLWVSKHPDYFVVGSEADLASAPANYVKLNVGKSEKVFAHGRDPYFPGWPDTVQLNYGNPALQNAMVQELTRLSEQCDGVRCDMAMLVLPEVFKRTWGIDCELFWPKAISAVHEKHPGFIFMAEVYWDLEWTLQQQGFDYCYDKRLYDRLREGNAALVREHFLAGLDFQDKLARFLENHDEPRAAATFDLAKHKAAAALTFLSPGLRFFHQGEFEGRLTRISPHLVRAPAEESSPSLMAFYASLLAALRDPVVRDGNWRLLESHEAWQGNWTHRDLIAFEWNLPSEASSIIVVNFGDHQTQGKVSLAGGLDTEGTYNFRNLLSSATYEWPAGEIAANGLFVDLPPWGVHLFKMRKG
jgi:glycosidase